jgi:hypothetical protein
MRNAKNRGIQLIFLLGICLGNFPNENLKKTLLDYQGIPDSQRLAKPIALDYGLLG